MMLAEHGVYHAEGGIQDGEGIGGGGVSNAT